MNQTSLVGNDCSLILLTNCTVEICLILKADDCLCGQGWKSYRNQDHRDSEAVPTQGRGNVKR